MSSRKNAARRAFIRLWKTRLEKPKTLPFISKSSTRDDVIVEARGKLRLLRARRRGPHAFSHHEQLEILAEVAYLRSAAFARERPDPSGRAFYVTIRRGSRHGFLYGPLDTQLEALEALPVVRRLAGDLNPSDAAFAEYGTASIDRQHAKPGVLNRHMMIIGAAAA